MGSDLILSAARWPHVPGDPSEPSGWDEVRAVLLAGVANVDECALEDPAIAEFGEPPEEVSSERSNSFTTWQEWARSMVRAAVIELLGDPDDGPAQLSRDATLLELDGRWWLIAGGTSAGEFPESTEALDQLVAAGLLDDGTTNAVAVRM